MPEQIFLELSLIIVSAVVISFIFRFLKQPLLIGYIITGLLLGSFLSENLLVGENLKTFSQLGIAFLLFMVGLNLNPRVIKEIGPVALMTGIGQVLFTSFAGFFIVKALGFATLPSIYISIAITFSSTIIITKILSDKGDLEALYGKIALGFLIVQDVIAILILMVISSSASENFTSFLIITLFKGSLAIIILFLISVWFLPKFLGFIAKSPETLFLFSLGWCFLMASLFYFLNLSIEIGALVAGMTLAMSPYAFDISSKIKPLKDFFIILFFISLGMQIELESFSEFIYPSLLLSLFILIGNPLILMVIMGILGYTKKTGFLTGLITAQISEFSIVMIALGIQVGQLPRDTLPFITLIGLITITGSTYLILYAEKLYLHLAPYLSIFERKGKLKDQISKKKTREYEAILFGYNRIGYSILQSFRKIVNNYTVIDFNPDTISLLKRKGIEAIYADAESSDLLDELNFKKVKIAISTIPSLETNLVIIEKIRRKNTNTVLITIAHQIKDARLLYKKGADYVILPHFLGGDYASKLIEVFGTNKRKYLHHKAKHLSYLNERIKQGHEHPGR